MFRIALIYDGSLAYNRNEGWPRPDRHRVFEDAIVGHSPADHSSMPDFQVALSYVAHKCRRTFPLSFIKISGRPFSDSRARFWDRFRVFIGG